MASRRSFVVLLASVVTASLTVVAAHAAAACAPSEHVGGDWASYGQDLTNARNQAAETTIDPANVATLNAVWSLSATVAGGAGSFQSTPVTADGCVFAGTSTGSIFAADASTGAVVWSVQVPAVDAGAGVFAPTVNHGVVYVNVGNAGVPYVTALDEATGATLWTTYLPYDTALDGDVSAFGVTASAVVFNGMLFVPVTGSETSNLSHPSFYILNALDGRIIKKTTVIPREDWAFGYAGGSIWTTAAVDLQHGYLYAGTANPQNHRAEHAFTNSILKIDVDPSRSDTFGKIVGNYKGDVDYDPAIYNSPQCVYAGEFVPGQCGQKDVDFGASPSLYTNSAGRPIIGDLQKSCTYHAVYADTMKLAWKNSELGSGGASGCASTSAYDATTVYVNVNGDKLMAFDKDSGATRWTTSYGDGTGTHYEPVTLANGVVYTVDNAGKLLAVDAANGQILLHEQMSDASGGTCVSASGAGVAVASNTVFAACDGGSAGPLGALPATGIVSPSGGMVFAYKLP